MILMSTDSNAENNIALSSDLLKYQKSRDGIVIQEKSTNKDKFNRMMIV